MSLSAALVLITLWGFAWNSSVIHEDPLATGVAEAATPSGPTMESKSAWRCAFLLKKVDLPNGGGGRVSATGELKNDSDRSLTFDVAVAQVSMRSELRFWMVGTPYVYRLRKDPHLRIDYRSTPATIAPGRTREIEFGIELAPESPEDPDFWYGRTRTDGFVLKGENERLLKLPAGLYGVSADVEVWPLDPKPAVGSRSPAALTIRSENMLWIEVGMDGTATRLTTRPSL
jgi:hypothetical protein